jgi:hypothetical protein
MCSSLLDTLIYDWNWAHRPGAVGVRRRDRQQETSRFELAFLDGLLHFLLLLLRLVTGCFLAGASASFGWMVVR